MVRFQTLGAVDLRDAQGHEIRSILAQPKRLALLAYLTIALPRGFHRRDRLASLFWPESETAKGRAALSRAIYALRTELGTDVVISRGDEEVSVDFSKLQCDVVLLEQLFGAREYRQTLDLYHGELLPAFYISDAAPEFDQWLDMRRDQLRSTVGDAAWKLAELAEREEKYVDAMRFALKSLDFNPGNETWLRRVITLLARVGDRASAAGVYVDFARRLEQEYELEPSAETQHLIAQIRAREAESTARPAVETSAPAPASRPAAMRRLSRARVISLTSAVVLVLVFFFGLRLFDSKASAAYVLAVQEIKVDADSLIGFSTLLSTSLARLEGVDVITEARLLEFGTGKKAARAAGVTHVIEGTLAQLADGVLRLDARRVDVRSGRINAAFSVQARDVHELADLTIDRIAADLHLSAPADRLSARTRSLVAYRFYQEALNLLYSGDITGAERLLDTALREDSTFAMAAYYRGWTSQPEIYWPLAARYAEHSSSRDRLLINAELARFNSDPRFIAIADTLAARYPRDAEGQLLYAHALIHTGRRAEAIPYVNRVLALDSAAIINTHQCRACSAFNTLINVYVDLDSMPAAERVLARWRKVQPQSWQVWLRSAHIREMKEDYEGMLATLDSAAAFAPDRDALTGAKTTGWARTANFEPWDAAIETLYETGDRDAREGALWGHVISLRMQGRYSEALRAAREFHRLRVERKRDWTNDGDRLNEALVLMETGRAHEAAPLFEAMARADTRNIPTAVAANRTIQFGHAATAYALARNRAGLLAMQDSIDKYARQTTHATANRMPAYVRGLILALDGKHEEAIQHLQRAILARTYTMARIPVALANSLIAAGRPNEAIPVLRGVLRGPISSVGLYASATDVEALLGTAYERANKPDSALIRYRKVLRSWRNADASIASRRSEIEARVASLERGRAISPR